MWQYDNQYGDQMLPWIKQIKILCQEGMPQLKLLEMSSCSKKCNMNLGTYTDEKQRGLLTGVIAEFKPVFH